MKSGYRGFSLIELIIVMFILTTVLAIIAPNLGSFMKGRILKEECRRIIALIRYARSHAISYSVPMKFWIDVNNRKYGIESLLSAVENPVERNEYPLPENVHLIVEPSEMNSEGIAMSIYESDGSLQEDKLDRFVILSNDEEKYTIVFKDAISGYILMSEDELMEWDNHNAQLISQTKPKN